MVRGFWSPRELSACSTCRARASPEVTIVTSGEALARQVEHALSSRGLANPRTTEGDYRFLTTGDPDEFRTLGTRFLQMPLNDVEHVETGVTV